MGKVFCAYARNNGAEAFLNFPASPYEMLDALEQLRMKDPGEAKFRIDEYYHFRSLGPFLGGENALLQLNALAQKLSEFDKYQETAFEGLLSMEIRGKENPLELPNLIDLAYSIDRCFVERAVLNDSQLGRLCVENGALPGVEDLPEHLFDLLNFERIGREHRQQEGGVFVERDDGHSGGYVERYYDLADVYKTLDLTLKEPDYAMLLKVSGHNDGKSISIKLPAAPEELDAALDSLEIYGLEETRWSCEDCRVPGLMGLVTRQYANGFLNRLAQKLADMSQEELIKYKALLEAHDCKDLSTARTLADQLPDYIFSPQFTDPASLAEEELTVILCESEAETIRKYLDLPRCGEALIEKSGGVLTSYGLIERKDGQPVQTPQNAWQKGGMTLG